MNKPTISTPRLTLRPMETRDRNNLAELFIDPIVTKTYMVPAFNTKVDAMPMVYKVIALSQDPNRFIYGIYLDDALIGLVNETDDQNKIIELGLAILPDYHNQGYATEAFSAVIDHLFANGFEEILAGAFAENTASLRVMEKCGMTRTNMTAKIEYRGIRHPCIYYSIKAK